MVIEKREGLVITVGGLHGTGKSTYAKALAKIFNLKHLSAGEMFRKIAEEKGLSLLDLTSMAGKTVEIDTIIDSRVKEESRKGSVVIDGLLSAWMVGELADVKIYLYASDDVRFRRIAQRDNMSYEEAKKVTLEREKAEKERFKRYYGIDLEDLTIYDLALNTGPLPFESSIKVLTGALKEYIRVKFRGDVDVSNSTF
ncbi:MAG: (d)CMP kinase [Candidatus Bathyarchaeota archaeon]